MQLATPLLPHLGPSQLQWILLTSPRYTSSQHPTTSGHRLCPPFFSHWVYWLVQALEEEFSYGQVLVKGIRACGSRTMAVRMVKPCCGRSLLCMLITLFRHEDGRAVHSLTDISYQRCVLTSLATALQSSTFIPAPVKTCIQSLCVSLNRSFSLFTSENMTSPFSGCHRNRSGIPPPRC